MTTILLLCAVQAESISVDFDAVPFEEAVATVRTLSGVNLVLDPSVRGGAPVTLRLKDVRVRTVLRLILTDRKLTLVQRDGVWVIAPIQEGDVVVKVYDVRDLTASLTNFKGPFMDLTPSGDPLAGAILRLEPETTAPRTDADALLELIENSTGGGDWSANPRASLSVVNGMLVVSQTARVHGEVSELLRLHRACGR